MKRTWLLFWTLVPGLLTSLAGCANNLLAGSTPTPATYTDPFAYCAATGTVDTPGPAYTGPQVPDVIVQKVRQTLDLAPDAPEDWVRAGTSWRCMKGELYACFVGANLPCQAKANTDRTPTDGMKEFCRQNPNAAIIPAVATGRETVYEWRCQNETPEIVRQVSQVDQAGYLADIWYRLSPN